MKKMLVATIALALVGSNAFASGFSCESSDGHRVKVYNKTSDGTRTPKVFVLSHADAYPATLLTARDEEISKTNLRNFVRYTVDGMDMDVDQVILQIRFKEGREVLEKGELAFGELIIVDYDGYRHVSDVECARYLKGE